MKLSEQIREPAQRIGGAVRSCSVKWFNQMADKAEQLEDRLEEIACIVANKGIAPEHELALGQLLTVGKIALGIEDREDISVASSNSAEK